MDTLYKGYVQTKGKKCIEKLKGRTDYKSYDEIKDAPEFGGVLMDDVVLIDIDDGEQAEVLMRIVEDLQLDCKVYCTSRGKHFLFKDRDHRITRCRTGVQLAIGLTADIKIGSKTSYEVLKVDGEERWCEWDIEDDRVYQDVPSWLCPVSVTVPFFGMTEGDGRNQAYFSYILSLGTAGLDVEQTKECIRLINKYIVADALDEGELETILRDEAFQKPSFFIDKTFQFDVFATYLRDREHVIKMDKQLHIYKDGVYVRDDAAIEQKMITYISKLSNAQRGEVLKYLKIIAPEKECTDANLIVFNNGLYDLVTNELRGFDASVVLANKIPWNYDPNAYSELADKTLDKLACGDPEIRALLEECIGYCFYQRNEMGKAFMLTGDKANGKSTFLACVKTVLGVDNVSALDLNELGDRFSTSMLYRRLANIGDDIADDFLRGDAVATFKKIVTGERIKAEDKGQDPFDFEPYAKLLFSANDIPRMKDKTGAVIRRLIIIPFNATFTKDDPDYDPYIKYKLTQKDSMEYLVRLGVEGLRRVLENNGFTKSERAQRQLAEYEVENNPILGFIEDAGIDGIKNQPTHEVFVRYETYCAENLMQPMSRGTFSKQINTRLGLQIKVCKVDGKCLKVFVAK